MTNSIILARIKRNGKNFEISVFPDEAQDFKEGNLTDVARALHSQQIFTDVKKGDIAKEADLSEAFQTTDSLEIAKIILTKGEIQTTSEQRSKEREQRRNNLINKIHSLAVDPKTGLPHPITRIDAALDEAKVHIQDHKSIDEQFDDIISKLRPILPIKIEVKKLKVTIEARFLGSTNQLIRNQKLLKENWTSDGKWEPLIEMPAGLVPDFIEKLNNVTSGTVEVEFEE